MLPELRCKICRSITTGRTVCDACVGAVLVRDIDRSEYPRHRVSQWEKSW